MTHLTRRRALRAAAKVAFSVSMVGCGGAIGQSGSAPGNGADDSGGSPSDASVAEVSVSLVDSAAGPVFDSGSAPVDGAAVACNTPPVGVDATVGEDVFNCCLAEVAPFVPDGGPGLPFADAAAADPELLACCNAIITHVNEVWSDYTKATGELYACCNLVDPPIGPQGPACTPWGPPVPPAMPAPLEVA